MRHAPLTLKLKYPNSANLIKGKPSQIMIHASVRRCRALPLLIFLLVWGGSLSFAHTFPADGSPKVAGRFTSLPIGFEVNGGQSDPAVRFLARGASYSIFFRDDRADILLAERNRT